MHKKIHWTEHSMAKMRQYRLSKSKIISVIYKPERIEMGIVPGTVAVMQVSKNSYLNQRKKSGGEIWLMYQDAKNLRKIISAWRYPGVSKPGEQIPIPEDIKFFIENFKEFK